MGHQQKVLLSDVLDRLHLDFGIDQIDPSTWMNNSPDLADLRDLIDDLAHSSASGVSYDVIQSISKNIAKVKKSKTNLELCSGEEKAVLNAETYYEFELGAFIEKLGDYIRLRFDEATSGSAFGMPFL